MKSLMVLLSLGCLFVVIHLLVSLIRFLFRCSSSFLASPPYLLSVSVALWTGCLVVCLLLLLLLFSHLFVPSSIILLHIFSASSSPALFSPSFSASLSSASSGFWQMFDACSNCAFFLARSTRSAALPRPTSFPHFG